MANRKILVVDDDEMMCMLTSNILSKSYDVVCALSGKEGIEKYASEKPDLILSDLMMPEMSGFEMMEKLRESYDVLIPFVFMTANSSDDSEKQGFESGAVDYIRKPFKADILLHRIDNIFSNIEESMNISLICSNVFSSIPLLINQFLHFSVLVSPSYKSSLSHQPINSL